MDNNNSIRFEHTPYHNVYLKDRKNIELTGVKNIESFDSLEFLIETSLGFLKKNVRLVLKATLMLFPMFQIKRIKKEKTVFLINCLNNGLSKTNSRN